VAFERPELSRVVKLAQAAFASVPGNRNRWTFVSAPDHGVEGLVENALPSFWSSRLSCLFAAAVPPAAARPAARLSRAEKVQQAHPLHARGLSHRAIGRVLGVSAATVVNYLKGYPFAGGGSSDHSAGSNPAGDTAQIYRILRHLDLRGLFTGQVRLAA